jgi:hypothetical protein
MTKIQKNCFNIAVKTKNYLLAVKLALIANREGGDYVYLDNVYHELKDVISPKQFSGYLSALTKDGFYIQREKEFGELNFK